MFTMVWLVVFLSRVTIGQKSKNNVKSECFQKIRAFKKRKKVQNKNRPKLFLKSFKICPNKDPKKAQNAHYLICG
jgi:hypothetical protein